MRKTIEIYNWIYRRVFNDLTFLATMIRKDRAMNFTIFAARRLSSPQRYPGDFTDGPLIVQFPTACIHNGR